MNRRHRLAPLLDPQSVALVGVSDRAGSIGCWTLDTFLSGNYPGRTYIVNPKHATVREHRSYSRLAELPEVPEMALLNVGATRIESLLDEAIAVGIPSVTIMDYCVLEQESSPTLLQRIKSKADDHGVLICGVGCMGYYNLVSGVHASYYVAEHLQPGNVTLIAHSGSVFTVLAMTDPRYRFNLIVSAGSEVNVSVAQYIDYALSLPDTRAIALFLETVREPETFVEALASARERNIPIVACVVGKTKKSAAFAQTHSGAIAGNRAALEAVFDQYGVLAVDNLDELLATAELVANARQAGPGGLGAVLDSGGLRQLLVDRADALGVPLASPNQETLAEIQRCLPHTLTADNPLDAAGPFSYDLSHVFQKSLSAMLDDPDTAVGWFEFDATDRFAPVPEYVEIARKAHAATTKPFITVSSASSTLNQEIAASLADDDIIMINGVDTALVAVRNLLAMRDYRSRPVTNESPRLNSHELTHWRNQVNSNSVTESQALQLLKLAGIPVTPNHEAHNISAVVAAADSLGYPVALKTAEPGINHKSDTNGVHLNLTDETALRDAYAQLAEELGPKVVVARMATPGVEIAFGMIRDAQFGPLVIVSAGGTLIEVLKDRIAALPPFSTAEAKRQLSRLKVFELLQGVRGKPAADIDGLANALSCFSHLAIEADFIQEIDINPVIVSDVNPVAVDALIVLREDH